MEQPHSADYLMVNQMMDKVFLKYRIDTMTRELRAIENDTNVTMNSFFKQKKPVTRTVYKENSRDVAIKPTSSSKEKPTDNTPCGSGYMAAKHLR